MRTLIVWIVGILVLCGSWTPASALPRFASRTGAKCQACHVNPTGKGMRTEFGMSYGRDDLTMPTFKESTDFEEFSTELGPNISIGADVRTLFFYNRDRDVSSFFQMQGDIYLNLQLNKKLSLYFDKGTYSGFEVFAIAKVLPTNGYVKAGKFMPAYGTRVDDHNAFIRGGPYGGGPFSGLIPGTFPYPSGLRFGERSEDNGIELGLSPGMFTFQAGIFNGSPGSGLTGVAGSKHKAVVLRGDMTFRLAKVNLNLGGSVYNAPSLSATHTYYGAFGSVSLMETITLNSEVDLVQVKAGTTKTGMIVWNELNCMVVPGIDLKLGYEFYDVDTDVQNGSFGRVTVGAEFFVLSGVELRPLYRFNMEQPREFQNDEFNFLFHYFL